MPDNPTVNQFGAPSLAKIYFDDLLSKKSELFSYLNGLPNEPEPPDENEWRDFKVGTIPGTNQSVNDSSVKANWSIALAAFGTTQGGVLIWGLDCRKSPGSKVDRVCGIAHVLEPAAFKSRLMQLHHLATDPPVLGVQIEAVENPDDPNSGFVVCFIPESIFKPIRAEYASQQYYIRAGDDSVVPSVSLLRSLFVPGSYSAVSISIASKLTDGGAMHNGALIPNYAVQIKNCGQVSVRGVKITLRGDSNSLAGLYYTPENWVKDSSGHSSPRHLESPRAIYPGEQMVVFTARMGNHFPQISLGNYNIPADFKQTWEFGVYSDNQPAFVAKAVFTNDDLAHGRTKVCETKAS